MKGHTASDYVAFCFICTPCKSLKTWCEKLSRPPTRHTIGHFDHLLKISESSALPAKVTGTGRFATTCLYPAPKSIGGFSTICSEECRKEQLSNCPQNFFKSTDGVLIPAYAPKWEIGVTHRQTGVRYFGTDFC